MSRVLRIAFLLTLVAWPGVARSATPGIPAIYIDYGVDCTFTERVDPGIAITSSAAPGPTLPPGTYQVLLYFPNPTDGYPCGRPVFTLNGPGVNIATVFPLQELSDEKIVTLQPSSTYVAVDATTPSSQRTFTTAASGSNGSLLPAPKSSAKGSSVQGDIVGSTRLAYRGTLAASVDTAGKATLRAQNLKAGRYDIRVSDADAHAGFFLRRNGGKPVDISGVTHVGKVTKRVTLTAGTWSFFSTKSHVTTFRVTS